MTVKDAVIQVMREKGAPMSIGEVYAAIMAAGLYSFKAEKPEKIVSDAIRRHCADINFPSAYDVKYFQSVEGGRKYVVLPEPVKTRAKAKKRDAKKQPAKSQTGVKKRGGKKSANADAGDLGLSRLQDAHSEHAQAFKADMLDRLKSMSPEDFEHFARNLLAKYGFKNVQVTPYSRDGGIDGYGNLHVGMSVLPVAFQCKRYGRGSVATKEVQEFRGSIQGKYVQGVFFTTSRFSRECLDLTFQAGAVPIVMIDGGGIVDLMIEKRFGVEVENLPIYVNAFDMALVSDE